MDVLEKKPPSLYNDELKKIMKIMQYKDNKLELKGSSSFTSQRYYSDYDLSCSLINPDKDELFIFLLELVEKINESNDLYFIELKLQTTGDKPKKIRVFPPKELDKAVYDKVFDSLDFIKLDLIARINNRFIEVSVIYSLNESIQSKEAYISSLEDEIKELAKEKKYYKILKRQFNIARANGDKKELLRLSKIFNGDMGAEYSEISNLEAIQTLLEHYQTDDVYRKIIVNLKDLHIPIDISNLDEYLQMRSKEFNNEAKQLIYELNS